MQVGLKVWYADTPGHDATCGSQGLLDSQGSSLPPPRPPGEGGRRVLPPPSPTNKRPRTLIRVHGHGPAFQIRARLAFPTAAIPSSGYRTPPERAAH